MTGGVESLRLGDDFSVEQGAAAGGGYSPAGGPPFIFGNLRESRRLRSGEVHYLDHPLLGAIVTIVPWEKPVEEDLDSADVTGEALDY